MNSSTLLTVVIVIAVLALVIYRQLHAKRLADKPLKLPAILGIIGVIEAHRFLSDHASVPVAEFAAVAVGLVAAVVLAYPRARSMTIYRSRDGIWMRRGTIATLGWWFATALVHVATALGIPLLCGEHVSGFSGFDQATLLIYLAVALGAQFYFLEKRRQRAVRESDGPATELVERR